MACHTEAQIVTVRPEGTLNIRPYCDVNLLRKILLDRYELIIDDDVKELASYDDRNYLIQSKNLV